MLSKSITTLEKIIHAAKHSNRDVLAHYQASQIRKYAATQRYSDNQRAQVICCQLQYYRPYWKGSLVQHHEIYSKRKGESQFRYHRKRKYDTIFLLIFNGLWARRSIQRTDVKQGLTPKWCRVLCFATW